MGEGRRGEEGCGNVGKERGREKGGRMAEEERDGRRRERGREEEKENK